ncbi:MAG: phospholipid carrier-dependent glycosyltransferase, partial [bacterium]|nr:phospholipid carrier-dependent glycosyltransferase [bacterium]
MSKVNTVANGVLGIMLVLMVASVWNESAIVDELAHIPAGYGYVLHQDYRLNPEHPPLLKTLAGTVSSLMTRANFPTDTRAWRDDINGQWDQGSVFLYESGNDADSVIFWARFPMMLLAVFFGGLLFFWTKKRFGNFTAILTLLFFAFSPTILTHSRYVTTDMGAAFGFFIGIIAFIKFLEIPTWKNAFLLGIAFGLAQLLKFSLVILLPLYGLLLIFWIISLPNLHFHERVRVFGRL